VLAKYFSTKEIPMNPKHRHKIRTLALCLAALPAADYIFVTEKDAAKLPPPPHAPSNIWVLPIDAQITPDLADWVLAELGIQAA